MPDPSPARHPGAWIVLAVSVLAITGVAVALVLRDRVALAVAYAALGWTSAAVAGLLSRRAPGPAVLAAGAPAMTAFLLVPGPPVVLVPFAVAIVRAVATRRRAWALGTVGAAYLVPVALLFTSDSPAVAARGFAAMTVLLIAIGAGAFIAARRTRDAEEARRRVESQRIAIEQERVRIARDLHDVLAHSLSSISVQAGVGLHLAAERPAAAVEALEAIRGVSGEALDEVRSVLGVLRGDEAAPVAPGPDLSGLPALVADARRAGARIDLTDELGPRPPRPVQAALFRVVQEALTNARRHAAGGAVTIALLRDGDVVVARVRDRPGTPPQPPVPGNGITGMQERVTSLGGSLELRPHADGLEVVARIPSREARP